MLRCSRCRHVFAAPGPAKAASKGTRKSEAEAETLSFPFAEDEEWTLSDEEEQPMLFDDAPDEREKLTAPDPPEQHIIPDDDDDEELEDEEEFEEASGSISLRPVFWFLFLVVAAYAVLARALYGSATLTQQLTRAFPMIGDAVLDPALKTNVLLDQVEGRYELSKEGKQVFLVTGRARNESGGSLNNVQVLAKLFDREERQIGEQISFCGNAVRLGLIRDLNLSQIAVIRGLRPSRQTSIKPGDTCPFVSIFTTLPEPVSSFTTEVAAAQRHTSGLSSPPPSDSFAADDSPFGSDFGVMSISSGVLTALRKLRMPRPSPSPISGSLPAPKMIRTMTRMTSSSPIPKPNIVQPLWVYTEAHRRAQGCGAVAGGRSEQAGRILLSYAERSGR